MPQYSPKPVINSLQIDVRTDSVNAFTGWQAKLNSEIAAWPGFISLEFLSPTDINKNWLVVQRFTDSYAASSWKESSINREIMSELKNLISLNGIKEISEDEINSNIGVTEVIVAEVSSGKVKAYREWSARVHQAEAKFPGFRGVYVQSPEENKGKYWITLLQFDTMDHLDNWLNSNERKKMIKEATILVSSLETHRIMSPYAGWFASIAKVSEMPSVWKQTMIVLLVLFPIVMIELKYLSPLLSTVNSSLATFIGNAISVSLISVPMMPIAIFFLSWWLAPKMKNRLFYTILGTLIVMLLYIAEIAFFWHFL